MHRYFGIVILFIILFLAACSPERNLARKYIKHHSGTGILILPTYELFKDNLSISYDTAINYNPEQFDSIAWVQSCYIQYVSDSLFLTTFTNNLINRLTKDGFDVYVDGSADIFLALPDPKWMIQIAQLQLNEDHRIYSRAKYSIETGQSYNESYRLNQVSLNSWFDASRANNDNKQVLYLEAYIQDDLHMGIDFNLMEGSIGLFDNRDSVLVDDVYKMAYDLGRKHAELLFDYFMNDYIRENLPAGIVNRQYYHFDRKTNSLKKGLKERFDVVN